MVVASYCSENVYRRLREDPWYRRSLRVLIRSVARLVERWYVFIGPSVVASDVLPDAPPNVHIVPLDEILECLGSEKIDIWHSLGGDGGEGILSLRHLSKQDFRVSCDCDTQDVCACGEIRAVDWHGYDGIVYPGKQVQTLHLRYLEEGAGGTTHIAIPAPIDLSAASAISKGDARRLLGLPQSAVLLLCFSDFCPRYGTDILPVISAFQLAARNREDLWLLLAGTDRANLSRTLRRVLAERGIADRTRLLAEPDSCSLVLLLSAADVFLHLPDAPSKDSHHALLYAMEHGLAVIAARWPGGESVLEHQKSGLLVSVYSHGAAFERLAGLLCCSAKDTNAMILSQATAFNMLELAAEIGRLADDAEYRETLGRNASAIVRARNHAANSARAYVDFWLGLKRRAASASGQARPGPPGPGGADHCVRTLCDCATPLDMDSPLRLTPLGEAALSGRAPGIYEDMHGILLAPIVYEVLDHSRAPVPPRALVTALADLSEDAPRRLLESGLLYHILWCLKQGLVTSGQFAPADPFVGFEP